MTDEERCSREAFPSVYEQLEKIKSEHRALRLAFAEHIKNPDFFWGFLFYCFVAVVLTSVLCAAYLVGTTDHRADYCYITSDDHYSILYMHRNWYSDSKIGRFGTIKEAVEHAKMVGCPELR